MAASLFLAKYELDDLLAGTHAAPDDDGDIHGPMSAAKIIETVEKFVTDDALRGSTTGLPCLDRAIHGLIPGHLTIIAGRPGSGKSCLAAQMAYEVVSGGQNALLVSTEMTVEDMHLRLAANRAQIPLGLMRHKPGAFTTARASRLKAAAEQIATDWGLLRIERAARRISEINLAAHQLRRQGPLGLVVIDFAQQLQSDNSRDEMRIMIQKVATGAAKIAQDHECPVILCSQINRAGADKPEIHHLSEGASLEVYADNVLILQPSSAEEADAVAETERDLADLCRHVPAPTAEDVVNQIPGIEHLDDADRILAYWHRLGYLPRQVTLKIRKSRHGAPCDMDLVFCGPEYRFEESEREKRGLQNTSSS